jgi:hypothetical protein
LGVCTTCIRELETLHALVGLCWFLKWEHNAVAADIPQRPDEQANLNCQRDFHRLVGLSRAARQSQNSNQRKENTFSTAAG